MEYTVVVVWDNMAEFIEKVNDMIADRWVPLGGVSCSFSQTETEADAMYSQAMVRGKESDD